jgi:hypothetical protein
MAITEESFMLRCWELGICPHCAKTFTATVRVGSGDKKRGGFCSLNCYAIYYQLTLVERQARILAKTQDMKWQ